MKLGKQEVVPRSVQPVLLLRCQRGIVGPPGDDALGLIEQVLATNLGLLDVMHHAIAARECVL